ncbi:MULTISPECIES: hypothetical protein [Xanthomonas]|jgi:hypothetical protein|uniref:hypothetical protein n=1 Tax=Xanthomonas TaxID=338 RepID=UPI0015CAD3B8|nr:MULTISPECIES: hypothetical protein [Xanthomonas]MBD7923543.1 hypothetical protein [Xanthomonas surreyensis]MBN6114160.1 hypothetical protein [Xanthomonas bonasiae]NYF21811.1 hypothetical protein [Xanthomonas sp. JAI131]
MSNYLPQRSYRQGKFELEVYPYVAPPDNVFEALAALQYGADFRLRFSRAAPQSGELGLIQLILPQTRVFTHTVIGSWNVDKRAADPAQRPMLRCLYGEPDHLVGPHSAYYEGQPVRSTGATECSLIDTPREFNAAIEAGRFSGTTETRFANYLVDLASGEVYDQGIVWRYHVIQDATHLTRFDLSIDPPTPCTLKTSSAHRGALARFLGMERDEVTSFVR